MSLLFRLCMFFGLGLLLAVLAVILVIPYRLTTSYYRRMVSRIPGPPGLPILGNALLVYVTRQEMIPLLRKLYEEYGPVFKLNVLGLTHVFCNEMDEMEKILSSVQHITKSGDYLLLNAWLGEGLLTSSGPKWHSRRKMLTPAFHFRILEDYVSVFIRCSNILVEKLRERTNEPYVDVNPVITLCTLDIICEAAMGSRINAQHGGAVDYVSAVQRMSELFQYRQLSPWLWRDWTFWLSSSGREQRRVLKKLHGFTMKVIKERQQEYRQRANNKSFNETGKKKRIMALLDLLLDVAESEPGVLSLEDIREEVDTFMFEGHDTTSASLSWTMHLLAHHPHVQKKAVEEQAEIFGDSTRDPTMDDLNQMKYLEQVIKESLRLYPSVPAFSRWIEKEVTIRGYTLPEGSFVTFSPLLLHRNPRIFPNPNTFDPDRFHPDNTQGRHPFAYIPFSAGSRSCIGQRFALLEEKAVLSAVLRNLELRPIGELKDVIPLMELILRPEKPLRVQFVSRPPLSSATLGECAECSPSTAFVGGT